MCVVAAPMSSSIGPSGRREKMRLIIFHSQSIRMNFFFFFTDKWPNHACNHPMLFFDWHISKNKVANGYFHSFQHEMSFLCGSCIILFFASTFFSKCPNQIGFSHWFYFSIKHFTFRLGLNLISIFPSPPPHTIVFQIVFRLKNVSTFGLLRCFLWNWSKIAFQFNYGTKKIEVGGIQSELAFNLMSM